MARKGFWLSRMLIRPCFICVCFFVIENYKSSSIQLVYLEYLIFCFVGNNALHPMRTVYISCFQYSIHYTISLISIFFFLKWIKLKGNEDKLENYIVKLQRKFWKYRHDFIFCKFLLIIKISVKKMLVQKSFWSQTILPEKIFGEFYKDFCSLPPGG